MMAFLAIAILLLLFFAGYISINKIEHYFKTLNK